MSGATEAAPKTGLAIDDQYSIYGDASVAPLTVFTLNEVTYLQLRQIRGAIPSVFAVTAAGNVPIRPKFDLPYLEIEGFEPELVLMYPGRRYVVIRHASATSKPPTTLNEVLYSEVSGSLQFATDELMGKARASQNALAREASRLDVQRSHIQSQVQRAEQTALAAHEEAYLLRQEMAAAKTSMASVLAEIDAKSNPGTKSPTMNGTNSRTWQLRPSDHWLSDVLKRWSSEAGVSISWRVPLDCPITASEIRIFHGDFSDAVRQLLKLAETAGLNVVAVLDRDTLVVDSQGR